MKSKIQNSPSEEELKRNHAMTRLYALYSSVQLHIDAEIEYRTYIAVSEQLAEQLQAVRNTFTYIQTRHTNARPKFDSGFAGCMAAMEKLFAANQALHAEHEHVKQARTGFSTHPLLGHFFEEEVVSGKGEWLTRWYIFEMSLLFANRRGQPQWKAMSAYLKANSIYRPSTLTEGSLAPKALTERVKRFIEHCEKMGLPKSAYSKSNQRLAIRGKRTRG